MLKTFGNIRLSNIIIFGLMLVVGMCWADAAFADDSVIDKVREKAVDVIEHYKPIVYILGGFGLVCVAWAAIFGKMNWKWFANLAIGLFLVAYMGNLIDFFTSNRYHGDGAAANQFKTTHMTAESLRKWGDTLDKHVTGDDAGSFTSVVIRSTSGYDEVFTSSIDSFENSLQQRDYIAELTNETFGDTLRMPEFSMTDDDIIQSGALAEDDDGDGDTPAWRSGSRPWGGGGGGSPYFPQQ